MKQRSLILLILCAFILMVACTPSALRRNNLPEAVEGAAVISAPKVSVPQVEIPDFDVDSTSLQTLLDTIS